MNTHLSELRVGFWPVRFIPIRLSWDVASRLYSFHNSHLQNNFNIRLNEVKLWVYWLDFSDSKVIIFWQWLANFLRLLKTIALIGSWKTILIVIVPTERDCQRWGSKSIAPYQASRGLLLRSTGIPLIFSYLIVKGWTIASAWIGASKSDGLKGSTFLPSLLVPSGKSINLSDLNNTCSINCNCFTAEL